MLQNVTNVLIGLFRSHSKPVILSIYKIFKDLCALKTCCVGLFYGFVYVGKFTLVQKMRGEVYRQRHWVSGATVTEKVKLVVQ